VGFAAPGYLIFAREGSLLAQRFHEQELRLEGAPLPIVQEINYFQPTGEAPFSISETGVLAYQGRGNLSKLVWVDRNGREIGKSIM